MYVIKVEDLVSNCVECIDDEHDRCTGWVNQNVRCTCYDKDHAGVPKDVFTPEEQNHG